MSGLEVMIYMYLDNGKYGYEISEERTHGTRVNITVDCSNIAAPRDVRLDALKLIEIISNWRTHEATGDMVAKSIFTNDYFNLGIFRVWQNVLNAICVVMDKHDCQIHTAVGDGDNIVRITLTQ